MCKIEPGNGNGGARVLVDCIEKVTVEPRLAEEFLAHMVVERIKIIYT